MMKRTITLDKETYLYLLRVINRTLADVDSAVSYIAHNEDDRLACPSYYEERAGLAGEQSQIHALYDVVLFGE